MPKTDKELAVEIVCTYIGARFSGGSSKAPLTGEELKSLVKDAYDAVCAIPHD